jgi:hypothetical protein
LRRSVRHFLYRPGASAVIGYVAEGQPRAYPTALLDGHELVNDEALGKPFTVGW